MAKYLVELHLRLGEYEKHNHSVVEAPDEKTAGIIALKAECHNTPDFEEFPDQDQVWDGGEFIYTVRTVIELSKREHNVLSNLGIR